MREIIDQRQRIDEERGSVSLRLAPFIVDASAADFDQPCGQRAF